MWPAYGNAKEKTLYIYQDADLSHYVESSRAIQKGIEAAFSEVNNHIAGYKINFKYLNHRGNVLRSKHNYQAFLKDPNALAIYSGIHSPPLINNLEFINKQKALTLVPWAAGGSITRYPSAENWVFRLSLDDTKAGGFIIDYAMKNKKCTMPHLLLEKTPWGNSNLKNMQAALKKYNIHRPSVTRFSWNINAQDVRTLLRNIIDSDNDCLILVGNAIEGQVIAQEMLHFTPKERLPIISHWGITGGNFHNKINAHKRKDLDLSFIQTCFAFTNQTQSPLAQHVFQKLADHTNGKISTHHDLRSAVGFIHAYDLTKLLIQAIKQVGLTGDMSIDRNKVRLALENLEKPIEGLVKTYEKPFSVFNHITNPDAHEALDEKHYCMAEYGSQNEIRIIGQ